LEIRLHVFYVRKLPFFLSIKKNGKMTYITLNGKSFAGATKNSYL